MSEVGRAGRRAKFRIALPWLSHSPSNTDYLSGRESPPPPLAPIIPPPTITRPLPPQTVVPPLYRRPPFRPPSFRGSPSPPSSPSPQYHRIPEKTVILVTSDGSLYANVEITGATSAVFIREKIFTALNIFDDEDQSRFSIYRTAIGEFALGDALTEDNLFELCRTAGDSKGSLVLLVSHTSANVHDSSYRPPIQPAYPFTPPVLPQQPPQSQPQPHSYNSPPQPYPPLSLLLRRSSRSRHGSLSDSSASEHVGYDADLDNLVHLNSRNRKTTRPPQLQLLPAVPALSPPFVKSDSPPISNATQPEHDRTSEGDVSARAGSQEPLSPSLPLLSNRPTFAKDVISLPTRIPTPERPRSIPVAATKQQSPDEDWHLQRTSSNDQAESTGKAIPARLRLAIQNSDYESDIGKSESPGTMPFNRPKMPLGPRAPTPRDNLRRSRTDSRTPPVFLPHHDKSIYSGYDLNSPLSSPELLSSPEILSIHKLPASINNTPPRPAVSPLLVTTRSKSQPSCSSQIIEEHMHGNPPTPLEDLYKLLEEYSAEHDLDKPVIETNSGRTSAMEKTPVPASLAAEGGDGETRTRSKKLIRMVPAEHKKRIIDRSSTASTDLKDVNFELARYDKLRKRGTRLWDGEVEEVKPLGTKTSPLHPDSTSGLSSINSLNSSGSVLNEPVENSEVDLKRQERIADNSKETILKDLQTEKHGHPDIDNWQLATDLSELLTSSTQPHKRLVELLATNGWSKKSAVEWLQAKTQQIALDSTYRRKCTKCLDEVVKKYHVFPSSFFVKNVQLNGQMGLPLKRGGFADIYKGTFETRTVCLKLLRTYQDYDEHKRQELKTDFCKEVLIWTRLSHPNVVPLIGVCAELFEDDCCIVSAWMSNDDIISFLKRNPDHNRLQSICDIAAGLEYLHLLRPPIVHGDIKGLNVLVDENCNCLLSDFGLSKTISQSTGFSTSTGGSRGSSRWMAPELFDYSVADGERQYRPPRDIYAFGCTILEIMTGRPPFDHIQHDAAVIFQVVNDKVRPLRPTDGWCPDDVWDLVTLCWQQDPSQRPGATSINGYLTGLRNGTETRPALALKHLVHGESKRRLSRIPGVGF